MILGKFTNMLLFPAILNLIWAKCPLEVLTHHLTLAILPNGWDWDHLDVGGHACHFCQTTELCEAYSIERETVFYPALIELAVSTVKCEHICAVR